MSNFTVVKPVRFIDTDVDSTDAICTILVGTTEHIISFSMNDGAPVMGLRKELELLKSAGMVFDFNELVSTYEKMVPSKKDAVRRHYEKKLEMHYNNSWVHRVEDPSLDGVELIKQSKESFLKEHEGDKYTQFANPRLEISYIGQKTTLNYTDTSSSRFSKSSLKYQLSGSITDYKVRSYTTSAAAIKKFKELVDDKIKVEKRKKELTEIRNDERLNKLKHLREMFGPNVEMEIKVDYSRAHSRNKSLRYETPKYFFDLGDRNISINTDGDDLYAFSGIRKLTKNQVKKMVLIVLNYPQD